MIPSRDNRQASGAHPREMASEIAHLDHFYHSQKGRMVAHFLRKMMQPSLQLEAKIDRVGFGYPFACLPRDIPPVLIPSEMGALAYAARQDVMPDQPPDSGQEIITASIESDSWPLSSETMNQIIMCHGLEYCFDGEACLLEANRVLTSAGELCLIIPNRRSLWVRDDTTPLGHGRPFSKSQITKLLTKTGFEVTEVRRALFIPPFLTRLPFRLARFIDHLGAYGWGMFGGVMMVRATKLRYATKGRKARALIPALSPALRPVIKPALGTTSRLK